MAADAETIQTGLILGAEWFFFYIPAALMAIWPIRKWMRVPPRKFLPPFFAAETFLCVLFSGIEFSAECAEKAGRNLTFLQTLCSWSDLIMLLILFSVYFCVVRLSVAKSLFVLTSAAAVLSFGGILNYILTAVQVPSASAVEISSVPGILSQSLFYLLYLIFFFAFWSRRMTWILENDLNRRTWRVAWVIPAIVCFCNNMMVPQYPEIMTLGRMLEVSAVVIGSEFALFMSFQWLFYVVVRSLVERYEAENAAAVLQIQAEQYRQLKEHQEAARRLRHDFRHMVFSLEQLADNGDLTGVKACIRNYLGETGKEPSAQNYCENAAVNALIAHFSQKAEEEGIPMQLRLDFPEKTPYSDIDLCILFGNILEDALEASRRLAGEERFIRLMTDRDDQGRLYIVMVNRCFGKTVFVDGLPRTTKGKEGGVGLSSVRLIAEKYGGMAEFHREDDLFYSNIMLPGE